MRTTRKILRILERAKRLDASDFQLLCIAHTLFTRGITVLLENAYRRNDKGFMQKINEAFPEDQEAEEMIRKIVFYPLCSKCGAIPEKHGSMTFACVKCGHVMTVPI